MPWSLILFAGLIVVFFVLPRIKWMPAREARQAIAEGARVLDVRSEAEIRRSPVDGAIAAPLGELDAVIEKEGLTKDQKILLHCASGTRSGMAVRKLKAMGYTRVFNIGGASRARAILGSRG